MSVTIHPIREEAIESALALSTSAGWNQTADDWRMLLRLAPETCLGIEVDGRLAATATLVSSDRRLGWVGMVLTDPGHRRKGFARALVQRALELADAAQIESVKLDATAYGQALYESLGFRIEQPVERWWRPGGPMRGEHARTSGGQPPYSLDFEAYGADRLAQLQALAERSTVFANGEGFALLRAGRTAFSAGPCEARTAAVARELIACCLEHAGEDGCFWDLLPSQRAAVELARASGFERQRELVRMVRGRDLRGNEGLIYAISGFELG